MLYEYVRKNKDLSYFYRSLLYIVFYEEDSRPKSILQLYICTSRVTAAESLAKSSCLQSIFLVIILTLLYCTWAPNEDKVTQRI